ncbi:MAG: ATP-binding protein, partial [Comamonas sp.]
EREAAQVQLAAGIERAKRLVEHLLALARQEAAPAATEAVVDLRQLAEQALADCAAAAQAAGLDMGLSEDPQLQAAFSIPGDAQALAMLMRNLLDNALKYVPAGGRVDVGWRQDGRGRALVVEDSGPGIAPEERERVVQRFVRGEGAGGKAGGSGLGLSIVQTVAERAGAQLVLDQSPALGGLRVQIIWPALAA